MPSLDYIFSSVHVKNLSPTAPQKDARPRGRLKRLPFNIHKTVMTTHVVSPFKVAQNASLTPLYGGNYYIHQMSHYPPPPPQHKKCFKPSDHLMYILKKLKGGLHTRGSPPPPPPPPETLTTNRAPGPTQETQKTCLYRSHLLHIIKTLFEKKELSVKSGNYNYGTVRNDYSTTTWNVITQYHVNSVLKVRIYSSSIVMR